MSEFQPRRGPGRPPIDSGGSFLTRQLGVRLSAEQCEILSELAKHGYTTVAQILRDAVCKEINVRLKAVAEASREAEVAKAAIRQSEVMEKETTA